VDWDGPNDDAPGYVGDGWDFNNGYNWDDDVNPSGEAWNIFRRTYAPYPLPMNLDIHVTSDIATSTGTINNVAGYTYVVKLTVDNGVTVTNSAALTYNSAGLFTVKTGAFYDMRYGQLALENKNLTMVIEEDAWLFCSALRHNNGAKVDVNGLLEAWSVSRISDDAGYRLAVYDGGEFLVHTGVPSGGWSKGGKVTMFIGSTVTLYGDHSAPSDYLAKVQAGEPGVWEVSYDGGWTTIKLVPVTLLLDILPDSCPNDLTVNLQSKGRLPMAILGSETFDVSTIAVDTISVGGVAFPVKAPSILDVSAPAGEEECACQIGIDGYADLVLHFSRRDVIQALGLDLMEPGTVVPVTVEGHLADGLPFVATDCVTLVDRE
jgi:hypothetical protein